MYLAGFGRPLSWGTRIPSCTLTCSWQMEPYHPVSSPVWGGPFSQQLLVGVGRLIREQEGVLGLGGGPLQFCHIGGVG